MAKKMTIEERTVDLMERVGLALIYTSTDLSVKAAAKLLGMDNAHAGKILKGIKKK